MVHKLSLMRHFQCETPCEPSKAIDSDPFDFKYTLAEAVEQCNRIRLSSNIISMVISVDFSETKTNQ